MRTHALPLVAVALVVAAPTAAAASPTPRPRILTGSERTLLRTGAIVVSQRTTGPAHVRFSSRVASQRGRSVAAVSRTTVPFTRRGTHRLRLRLTAAGRRVVSRCGASRLSVTARIPGRRATKTRRTLRRSLRCGAAVEPPLQPQSGSSGENFYRVGTAVRSINPDANGTYKGGAVWLGGYGATSLTARAATGILGTGPAVRAFAVSDGKHHFAIADIEVQGWFAATKDGPLGIEDMRKAVEARTKGAVKAEEVVVQSDHTHGGADAIGVWGGVPTSYRKFMFDQTVDAIVEAIQTERPGTLYYGTVDGRDLQSNQFDYDAANRVMDSEMRVLQARDGFGKAFATLMDFSSHATVLGSSNTKITGDWPQAANPALEKRFGGTAVTVVGTLGRTQPSDRGCQDKAITQADAKNLCSLSEYADRVADRAAAAVAAAKPLAGDPVVVSKSFLIQDVATNAVILGLDYTGVDGTPAPVNRSFAPPWLAANVLGTVTATARIGDVLMSSIPGEAYPQIALKLRELAPGFRGYMTAGLANDQLGYLIAPFPDAFPEPVKRTFFNQRGDQINPIDNDNYAFNVSPTLGDRVTCSMLRGAGEVSGKGMAYRDRYDTCGPFANDAAFPEGFDTQFP